MLFALCTTFFLLFSFKRYFLVLKTHKNYYWKSLTIIILSIHLKRVIMNSNEKSFCQKLHDIVKKVDFDHIIRLNSDQVQLQILNVQLLEKEVLPLYYRHSHIQSFIRQLNLYGFQRIKNSNCLKFTHEKLKLGKSLKSLKSKHQISRQKNQNKIPMRQNEEINVNIGHHQTLENNNRFRQAQQHNQQQNEQADLNANNFFNWNYSYQDYMQYARLMNDWHNIQCYNNYFIGPFNP